MTDTPIPAPDPNVVEAACKQAAHSPCRSQRGAIVFTTEGGLAYIEGRGYNHKPKGFDCDRSATCKATCRTEAVHAEQMALVDAGGCAAAELLHVKIVDGQLVPSGGPSCIECSKLACAAGIRGVWLYHTDGWKHYPMAEFHRLSLAAAALARPREAPVNATLVKAARALIDKLVAFDIDEEMADLFGALAEADARTEPPPTIKPLRAATTGEDFWIDELEFQLGRPLSPTARAYLRTWLRAFAANAKRHAPTEPRADPHKET